MVGFAGELFKVAIYADFILSGSFRNIVYGLVQGTQTRGCYSRVAAQRNGRRRGLSLFIGLLVADSGEIGLEEHHALQAAHTAKVGRGRDDTDMIMEDARQAVLYSAHDIRVCLRITVHIVFRAKHLFSLLDSNRHGKPVAGLGVFDGGTINTMVVAPRLDKVDSVRVRSDKRIDLPLRQVCAISVAS